MANRKFNAKVLLYGEYTVLFGGQALAIPTHAFSGHWASEGSLGKDILIPYCAYLSEHHDTQQYLDTDRFQFDLDNGLGFECNIPIGYGLGSSGAVTAAVYDRYGHKNTSDPMQIKSRLGDMESYFHGQSSGLDPLVSLLDEPLLIQDGELTRIEKYDTSFNQNFFLLDSGESRSTSKWVGLFNEKLKDPKFESFVHSDWKPLVDRCIGLHFEKELEALIANVGKIQSMMAEFMTEFIPNSHRTLWNETLNQKSTALKLCGAGGGGMTLGIGSVPENTKAIKL